MLSNVFERDGYYYFDHPGKDCVIGPYFSRKECDNDCIRLYTTGFIAAPEEKKEGTVKCVECEDVRSLIDKSVREKYGKNL